MDGRVLKLGTRGSRLALWQAEWVRSQLTAPCEIEIIKTSGDQLKDVPLQGQSTMGFFTREIERALLERRVDLAVHSLKDLPVEQPEGLELGAILERHDPNDALLVRPEALDASLPLPVRRGARVGAGSLRRSSTLRALRPDLEAVLVRGNVPTRVRKTVDGDVDAIVLARAGIARLGLDVSPLVMYDLDPATWVPAPGQAAVAIEVRSADAFVLEAVSCLDHAATRSSVELERRLLVLAGGGCHAPFAAWVCDAGGAGVVQASVGASARDGTWRLQRYTGPAVQVEEAARSWFEQGCPGPGESMSDEGICAPARQ
ncbi:MAG: hydroxymethylbilane synthase [Deltaproteobacteria bacterium]|nr:hydroxymethylbilane synthase [Deltaproteobacteria bacterium]